MEIKVRCQVDEFDRLDIEATKIILIETLKAAYHQQLKDREEEKEEVIAPIISNSILNLQKKLILCHEDKVSALKSIKEKGIEEATNLFAAILKIKSFLVREAFEKLMETTILVSDGLVERVLPTLVLHIKTAQRAQPRPLTENYFQFLTDEKVEELKEAVFQLEKIKAKKALNRFGDF